MSGSNPVIDQAVSINRIEIRRLMLPLTAPLVTRHGQVTGRDIVVVRIDADEGVGWGECSALPEPTYTDEFASEAFAVLSQELAPRLVRRRLSVSDLHAKVSAFPGNPMAKASLEMALLDVVLTSKSMSLGDWLGVSNISSPAGATIGIVSEAEALEQVAAFRAEGYRRIKLKISSSAGLDVVRRVSEEFPELELQIDPNGGCRPDDIARLVNISEHLSAIEQPFDPKQIEASRQLVAQVDIPIIADEPIDSLEAAQELVRNKACSAIAVKPPRLGGLVRTIELRDACLKWGVPLSAGGMLECGLGRHSLAAVAAMDGFDVAGDLSPASRWIRVDPWPDIEFDTTGELGTIAVPTGNGVAPKPDLEVLGSVTTSTTMVT